MLVKPQTGHSSWPPAIAVAAGLPDDGLMLGVHGDIVSHGGVVGEFKIEANPNGRFCEGWVAVLLCAQSRVALTVVQLTPMNEDDELDLEQSELPV